MGTTMGNPECEWVRVRLPLWVGASDDLMERNGEGSDLSPDDRRSIERHLGSCPCCSQHRAGLERALETLGFAASSPPSAPEGPSLWLALERRMMAHQARSHPRWLRAVHGVSERGLRAWDDFHSERALRFAWMRDSLGEALMGAGLRESRARGQEARRHRVRRPAWIIGTGVAAAILVLIIGLPEVRRQQESARSIIRANAQPLPGAVTPSKPVEAEKTPALANSTDNPSITASELAQADPIPVPETPPTESAPASKTITTAAPAPSPSPSRWNYDLEHGTPMPPHARDPKPVY
jgi:hypothetical protein